MKFGIGRIDTKHKWFLPIVLSLIILALIIASAIFLYLNAQDKKHTIEVDQRIKQHVLNLDGRVKQNLTTYFQKSEQKDAVQMHVKLGDTVQKGDPLFTYNDKALFSKEKEMGLKLDNKMIEKDQIEGQILALENAQQDAAETEKQAEIEAQLNWLDSELTKAENNIDILKEQQEQVSSKIDALTVKANTDGKVVKLDQAQIDKFSDKTQNKPILVISDDKYFVEGTTDRKEIEFLEQNLKLEAEQILHQNKVYNGTIDAFETLAVNPEAKSPRFVYRGGLEQHAGLYIGDKMKVKVHLSYKNHIWLPKEYVKKKLVTEKDGQKLQQPEKEFYVRKVYGDQLNEEKVKVQRYANGQYLITSGLSSIDVIKAFH